MQHKILNDKDDYLIKCRSRNNREIERVLRSFLKRLFIRETIPLDDIMYPDYMIDDMRQMGRIASRLIDQLDSYDSSGIKIRQLEMNFEVGQ